MEDTRHLQDLLDLLVSFAPFMSPTSFTSSAEITTDKVSERPSTCIAQACALYSVPYISDIEHAPNLVGLPTIISIALGCMKSLHKFCVEHWSGSHEDNLLIVYQSLLLFVHSALSQSRTDSGFQGKTDQPWFHDLTILLRGLIRQLPRVRSTASYSQRYTNGYH